MKQLILAVQEGVVITGKIEEASTVYLDDAICYAAQEGPVMSDKNQRQVLPLQELLKPGDRVDIEMVGWLVE